jgi:predicted regulator of Ras-like GTPase activity (Roadblock/LC7/MglB family)
MSIFLEILKKTANRASDIEMLALMGTDGISVERLVKRHDQKLESLAAELSAMMHHRVAHQRETGMGEIEELRIVSRQAAMIAVSVTPEYFLFAALPSSGLIGRARYALRMSAVQLAAELS